MSKILSLIIPTYNMGKYLEACLLSLVLPESEMGSLEVLIINDGSIDNSSEIAHELESRYPDTFIVVDKENGHYGSCINKGLALATGKYVKILDADDFFNTQGLVAYINYLKENDADLFLTANKVVREDGSEQSSLHFSLEPGVGYGIDALGKCLSDSLPHQSVTWRTDMVRSASYKQTEGIPYTDLEWVFRPLRDVEKVMYFQEVVYVYRRGREDQTVSPKYHCANMWKENGVVLGNVKFFESVKDGLQPGNRTVMETLLRRNVERVYFHYLINFPKYLENSELVEFDKTLYELSPGLYESVSGVVEVRKFTTIHHIAEWRKKQSRSTLTFRFFDLGNSIGQFIWKLRHTSKI